MKIKAISKVNFNIPVVYLVEEEKDLAKGHFTKQELAFAKEQLKVKNGITFNNGDGVRFVLEYPKHDEKIVRNELLRRRGADLADVLNRYHFDTVQIVNLTKHEGISKYLTEGVALASYEFHTYKKKIFKRKYTLKQIEVLTDTISKQEVEQIDTILTAVTHCKELVNEPFNILTSVELGKRIQKLGKDAGFKVEVLDKKKIQAMKMGGILSVNQGSHRPPTFSIMEWKPENAKNKQPLVFVGKGVVYDTGGYSIKPTPGSMDHMKSDMAGAAAVASSMYAIAKLKLPYHVVALVPSSDNMVSSEAYVPGDIVTMMNGLQVEVLNTDAEGRMLLADALYYADRYKPELVIDIATLTGASMRAVGPFAYSYYSTADSKTTSTFHAASEEAYERYVQHPLWDDYDELIQSDFADLRNIGGPSGGSITAAKFLQHFVSYPWMHMDIAGMAWDLKKSNYRSAGATGFGVRTLVEYVMSKCK